MPTQAVTSITCPNCRTPFTAPVQQIVDAQADPEAKSRLLAGQLNAVICPHCGFQGALNAPFVYHDAGLELALIYMPMDLGITDVERQKAIGELTNQLMRQLPAESRKGYLLQPRTFFSVETLIDAMLEQDEETRELVETQRRKVELFEQLSQLDPNDSLAVAEFIGAHEQELDDSFFQLLDVVIRMAESQGDTIERDRLTQHQAHLMEKTSTGRLLKAQRAAIDALTADPSRETLVEQLVAAEEKGVREALVTVGRELLDYAFFQTLTARIDAAGAAGDEATKTRLISLRKEVQEIRDQVDVMAMAVLDARARLLRDVMVADDPQEKLRRHLPEIDDTFLGVLSTNIQRAASEGRQDLVDQLRSIGDMAIAILNENVPPEIRLMNRLVAAENDERLDQLLEAERERLDQDFLELVERAVQDLLQAERHASAERLRTAAERIKEMIAAT
jgi:hypothetical protein